MKEIFILYVIVLSFTSCGKNNDCTEIINENCICPDIFDPVCGCNDKQYENLCVAECLGITEYRKGLCISPFIGKWKLIAYYADPGDGSGSYKNVESNLILEIKENGDVVSNGPMCDLSIEAGKSSSGKFSFTDKIIEGDECKERDISLVIEDDKLVLSYLCIEGCGKKFERI